MCETGGMMAGKISLFGLGNMDGPMAVNLRERWEGDREDDDIRAVTRGFSGRLDLAADSGAPESRRAPRLRSFTGRLRRAPASAAARHHRRDACRRDRRAHLI